MKIFFKKRKKVLAFCKKVLYTNEVGCGKQQKSRANDTNEYGQLVKGLRRRPLKAESRVQFPYELFLIIISLSDILAFSGYL